MLQNLHALRTGRIAVRVVWRQIARLSHVRDQVGRATARLPCFKRQEALYRIGSDSCYMYRYRVRGLLRVYDLCARPGLSSSEIRYDQIDILLESQ